MRITPGSATFTYDGSKASPDVHRAPGEKTVIFHLTHGFSKHKNPGDYGKAWTGKGSFRITVAPNESLNTWDFGFIQIQKINDLSMVYGGADPADGGVVIHVNKAPALKQSVALDSIAAFSPWTRGAPKHTLNLGLVTCETGDHPNLRVARALPNSLTGRLNYLFKVIDDRDFWTVLTARDTTTNPDGDFQHQLFFHTKLRYEVQFQWRNGEPQIAVMKSALTPDKTFTAGAPTDAAFQALLKKPEGPQANELMKKAIDTAVMNIHGANQTETVKREPFIPDTFFGLQLP